MVRTLGSQVKMTTMIKLIQNTQMMTFQRRARRLMSLMIMSLQKPALSPLRLLMVWLWLTLLIHHNLQQQEDLQWMSLPLPRDQ